MRYNRRCSNARALSAMRKMKDFFGIKKQSMKAALRMLPVEHSDAAVEGFERHGRIVGLTKGQFSLIHLIRSILQKIGTSHLILSTWSAGVYDGAELKRLKDDGTVLSVLIITDRSYSTRQKNYAIGIEEAFGKDNIRTTNTHAKFVLLWNDAGWRVTIRSSMNLNENKRCENFDVDDDPDIFTFFKDFVDDVFNKMPVGFTEYRGVVDPVFDALMGGTGKIKGGKQKQAMRFFDKNGRQIG